MAFNKVIMMLVIIASSFIFKAECQTFEKLFIKLQTTLSVTCNKSLFDPEFYRLQEKTYLNLKTCVKDFHLKLINQRENQHKNYFTDHSDAILTCNNIPNIMPCIENAISVFEFCINDEENKKIQNALKLANSFVDYICLEEGKRIEAITNNYDCFIEQKETSKCYESMVTSIARGDLIRAGTIDYLNLCRSIREDKKCLVEIFNQCTKHEPITSPSSTVEIFASFLRTSLDCDKIERKAIDRLKMIKYLRNNHIEY